MIRGGTALNIVPRDCTFDFEVRHLPFDDPDAFFADVKAFAATFLSAMHAISPQTYIEFDAGSMVLATYGRANSGTVRGDRDLAERYLNLFFKI